MARSVYLKIVLYWLTFPVSAWSQNPVQVQQTLEDLGSNSQNYLLSIDNRYQGIKGTVYFDESWQSGKVETSAGEVYEQVKLRYDTYHQVLEVKNDPSGMITALNTFKIRSFSLGDGDDKHLFVHFDPENLDVELADKYFEVLLDGRYTLLKLHQTRLKKADFEGAYSANRPYDEFIPEAEYYISIEKQKPEEISRNSKKVASLIEGLEQEARQYIKEKSIDLSQEKDLIHFFQHFNSL